MQTKLLQSSDIEAIILRVGIDSLYDQLIEHLHEVFSNTDLSDAMIPKRTGIHYSNPDLGLLEWMPASINRGKASLKLVGYHPSNPKTSKLPTVISSICVFDTQTGHLNGILDGTFLTALRTGAMSAVASRALAKQKSRTLGIIGCGAQAVTQAHALSRVLPIEEILFFDIDAPTANSFPERIGFLGKQSHRYSQDEVPSLLERSDILCTCTSEEPGTGPLFADFAPQAGLHINAVGSDFPEKFELPVELLRRAAVIPDFMDQALIEGECQQLDTNEIQGELSNILGKPDLLNSLRDQLTVFDSTGHALADYATALLFLDYASEFGLGEDIDLECIPNDPKDPYSFIGERNIAGLNVPNANKHKSP